MSRFIVSLIKVYIYFLAINSAVADISLYSNSFAYFAANADVIHSALSNIDGFLSVAIGSLVEKVTIFDIPEFPVQTPHIDTEQLQDIATSSITSLSAKFVPIYYNVESELIKRTENTISSIASLYDRLIEADPRLTLKTNEYIKLVFQDNIKPVIATKLNELDTSPLVNGFKERFQELSDKSTNEVAYEAAQIAVQKITPVAQYAGDFLVDLAGRIERKLIVEPSLKLVENLGNTFDTLANNVQQEISTSTIPNLPTFTIDFDAESVVSTVTGAIPPASVLNAKLLNILNELGPRLELANAKFSEGLSESGNILSSNLDVTFRSFEEYTSKILSNVGDKVIEAPTKIIDYISQIPSSRYIPVRPPGVIPTAPKTLADYTDPIANEIAKIKQWSLFSDPDHWENGYWEQQATKIQNVVKTLDQNKANEYINDIQMAFDKAGKRFIERSEVPIAKYNQIVDTLNKMPATVSTLTPTLIESNLKSFTEQVTIEGTTFLSGLQSYVDTMLVEGDI